VVKGSTWFTLFLVSVGTVAATVSCGSDEGTAGAPGGGSFINPGGGAGTAGRAGSGSVGRGGNGTGGNTGGGSNGDPTALGSMCSADSQCGEGMVCVTAGSMKFAGAGPSQGMCTMACDTNDQCDLLKSGAACANFGTEDEPVGYCIDSCVTGDVVDLNSKCAGRSDFVCYDFGETLPAPFCVPHCRSDAECGTGLYCDKSSLFGLCSKTKPTGDPVGTSCNPEADTQTCEGYCIHTDATDDTKGQCIELCSFGSECMYGSGTKPKPGGLCAGPLGTSEPGPMDLGYCAPNCGCTSDCVLEGDVCRKWPAADAAAAAALGAPGVCYLNVTGSVELTCGEGGAGGAGGEGGEGGAAPATGGHGGTTAAGGTAAGGTSGGSGPASAGTGGTATPAGGGGGTGGA